MSRRRSSHCTSNGNPKTCLDGKGGFKLFGVRLSSDCCMPSSSPGMTSESSPTSDMAMRKSVSMGNLCSYGGPEGRASPLSASQLEQHDLVAPDEGYASDDLVHTNSSSHERKKGVPWTEEEHRSFLSGLQALGKGDWRGISRNFVTTRTPTQVASHAQKYFLRRNNLNKRRRRSSLFDITPDSVSSLLEKPVSEEAACEDPDVSAELSLGQSIPHGPSNTLKASRLAGRGHASGYLPVPAPYPHPRIPVPLATSDLIRVPGKPLERQAVEVTGNTVLHQSAEVDIMEVVPELVVVDGNINIAQSEIVTQRDALWPRERFFAPGKPEPMDAEFEIVKPVPIIASSLQKADEMLKISEPNTNMARRIMDPTPLSFELLGKGSRHSAFHVTFQNNGSRDVDGQGSLNSAISVP